MEGWKGRRVAGRMIRKVRQKKRLEDVEGADHTNREKK